MQLTNFRIRSRQGGFSLVELMVAMAAGLIIIGAAVIFTVSTMRSYSENILSARLTQELRAGMNLIVRELRRSGHDSTAVSRVLTTSAASTFDEFEVSDDCVIYEYDRNVGADGPNATEMRGFRLSGGALQLNASSDGIDCDADADWEDITDPTVVQITKFDPVMVEATFCAQIAERDPDPSDGIDETVYDMAYGSVKTVSLCLQGQMVSRDDITRYVTDSVRIRAEDLRFDLNVADNTCDLAAVVPQSPSDLNDDCAVLVP